MQRALDYLKKGYPIIIVDDFNREYEADLVAAGQCITDATMHFMITHSSGVVCMSMTEKHRQRLKLELAYSKHHDRDIFRTCFASSIESSEGISTGISARDRAHTMRVASNPQVVCGDIISPGHVLTLQAHNNLLDSRRGHTEASIEMCRLAGLYSSAALVEIPNSQGGMLKGDDVKFFAEVYRLPVVTIDEIIKYKERDGANLHKYSESKLPTKHGDFKIAVWQSRDKEDIVVLYKGDLRENHLPLRIHSSCLTGDVFHSMKCDCNYQLNEAMDYINSQGRGMVIYLDQEGRGIGIAEKIRAYSLQDEGVDTVEANLRIGKPIDARNFDYVQDIIRKYEISSVELITNNPEKIDIVRQVVKDVRVRQVVPKVNEYNRQYLQTKIDKLHHKIAINIKE